MNCNQKILKTNNKINISYLNTSQKNTDNEIQSKINEKRKKGYKYLNELKDNNELISKYDKRINDMLHKIEFHDATPNEAYKMYMKLQGFLRKKRALKEPRGTIYVPRTETGNYIINGKVTKMKRDDKNGNR